MLNEKNKSRLSSDMDNISRIIHNLKISVLDNAKELLSIDGAKFFKDQFLKDMDNLECETVGRIGDRIDEIKWEEDEVKENGQR